MYATRGLIESVLRMARDRDPDPVTVSLSVTEAGELPECDLPPETPVFTHFYMPDAGGSINFVFGMDLGIPAGQTEGKFVSHPRGELTLSKRDDLHEVVFVAAPPWDVDNVAAFDRSGRRRPLELLDLEPPEEFPE